MSLLFSHKKRRSQGLRRVLQAAKILGAVLLLPCVSQSGRAQFVAFNDHYSGPGTHPNATTWNAFGTTGGAPGNSGALKDITTGANLPVTLTINNSGAAGGATSGAPAPGTPAYNTFNAYIDFGSGTLNHAIQTPAAAIVSHVFSGLNPARRYNFKATAVRGDPTYTNRWILAELVGASSFTRAHTPGVITSASESSLNSAQAAMNTGVNAGGDVVGWDDIDPGADGTITITQTQYTGPAPGNSPLGVYGYSFVAIRLEEINATQSAVAITTQPASQTVPEGKPALFSVVVSGSPSPTIQWYRNDVLIPGATAASYGLPAVATNDNGALFRVIARNVASNVSYSATSSVAILTVIPDTTAPLLARASQLAANQITLTFSEPVLESTATNFANYSITSSNGSLTLSNAVLQPDQTNLVITTSVHAPSTTYIITVNNVRDTSAGGNQIAANSQINFLTAAGYIPLDIGNPAAPGIVTPISGGYDISSFGLDIGTNSDQFTFAYQQKSGNFDFQVRVESLSLTDPWAKAGLMVRQNLTTNSTFAAIVATPSVSGVNFLSRLTSGGNMLISSNAFPVNYPYTWLRIQRNSSTLIGYGSFDGINWVVAGAAVISMTDPVYFGYAVAGKTNLGVTARFRDLAVSSGIIVSNLVLPFEPLGSSTRRSGLVFSEIMYHPAPRADGKSLEFVEIFNTQAFYEDISRHRLSGDIDFSFPEGTILPAGGFIVVAKDPAALQAAYGLAGTNIFGPYTNSLPNDKGTLRLRDELDAVLLEVQYDTRKPWPIAPDGTGHSMVLARASYGEGNPLAWAQSDVKGGSPGGMDSLGPEKLRPVVINEFLAHTDLPQLDYIELFNRSTQPIDISGTWLSDDGNSNKFRIPDNTTIPARGFLTFNQYDLGFGLSAAGESIYLVNSNNTRVIDCVKFGAQENGVSMGRYPDGAPTFNELTAPTPNSANTNAAILTRDIVINEIMYNPISGNDDDEYIELYNKGTTAINLRGWKFTRGINFTFPSNTVLAPDGYLVVAKNASNLFSYYGNLSPANTVGDYGGALANGGDTITLSFPDQIVQSYTTNGATVTTNYETIYIAEDEVAYGDGGRWGKWSDGGGSSLELIDARSDNRLPSNWADSDETAKAQWTTVSLTALLDNGAMANGDYLHVILQDEGECLVDDIQVISAGSNYLANSSFENNPLNGADWFVGGTHETTFWETNSGYNSQHSLHLVASGRGDTAANKVRGRLLTVLATGAGPGTPCTINAQVRWLKGARDILFRMKGNFIEAPGRMNVPVNLGTPGGPNSRALANVGPAVYDVGHSPILPAANQAVLVTARVNDPDGIGAFNLVYRNDTLNNAPVTVPMLDNGIGGDAIAGDGLFSATIPGATGGQIIAFYLQAADGNPTNAAVARFPNDAPIRECLIRFGEPLQFGAIASYRIWCTTATVNRWTAREHNSNKPLDCTFVYNNYRAIYNANTYYSGSPFHTPGYTGPMGGVCDYILVAPVDDLFLGTTDFVLASLGNLDNEASCQAEQMAFWIGRKIGAPYDYRRYFNMYFNGLRRGRVYEDSQQPNSDMLSQYFPDDNNGNLHKIEDWFEFTDDIGDNGRANTDAKLSNFTSGGSKKLARYRWNFRARAVQDSPNDYQGIYNLVDAFNAGTPEPFYTMVRTNVDVEQWMRVFATERIAGNWDSYGYNRGKNMYCYKPTKDKWKLMMWDIDMVLAQGARAFDADMYSETNDTLMDKFKKHPPFSRAFYRALQDAINGPMLAANVDKIMSAKYAALLANGINATSPSAHQQYIASRRNYFLTNPSNGLASVQSTFSINVPGGLLSVTNNNLLTISGTAPIEAKTIVVNGVEYPIIWTSVSNWTMRLVLMNSNSVLAFQGLDNKDRTLTNVTGSVVANYYGPVVQPEGAVLINEIMYHPANNPEAGYIELINNSSTFTFDLSGWKINGLDYTFPAGTFLTNRQYIVLAKNRGAFAAAYGLSIPVFDQFGGNLDLDGETLSLLRPVGTNYVVVDKVRYEAQAPWGSRANGFGASLQLIDPSQDNARVSNWSDGSTWRYYVNTNLKVGTEFSVWLTAPNSDVYLDNIYIAQGSVAETGTNWVLNGGFETGTNYYRFIGGHTNSTLEAALKFAGSNSLHLVSGSAGGSPTSRLIQPLTNIVSGAIYSLSFWYLPTTNSVGLNIRLGTVTNYTIAISAGNSFSPATNNPVASLLPTYPLVWLNEVQPENTNSIVDRFGEHEPWIEIFNSGTNPISMEGFTLATSYTNLSQWAFPTGSVILPGQFKVVFADGQPEQTLGNEWHTTFRLSPTNGSLALSRNGLLCDYLNYAGVSAGFSYGDYPDGQLFERQLFYFVTPGAPNNPSPVPIAINEWMASNTRTLRDPLGNRFEDWFELYNFGSADVDLSGYYLTDDFSKKKQFRIPNGIILTAGGHLLVWADNDNSGGNLTGGALHANFNLAKGGEVIALYSPEGMLVDSVVFGAQDSDISQGRYPDGNVAGVFYSMQLPTPNAANTLTTGNQYAPVLAAIVDKTINEGSLLSFICSATDADVPAQALSFSLDVTAPLGAGIDSSSGQFSWTPMEDQGPGVYSITVKVTDNAAPAKTDSKTFSVTVNEVNLPPALADFAPQSVDERTLLQVQAVGSDPDLPAQTLTYSLAGSPPGNVTIDSTTGLLSWTPTESQGPATASILVRVTDNGTPSLSATGLLTVLVREVNTPPVLSSVADRVISVGTLLSVTNFATDSDLPANLLSYSLDPGYPNGAGITSPGGLLTWTPAADQSPSTNAITVRVSDDGSPILSATRTFHVIVVNQPKITQISRAENGSVTLRWESYSGLHYRIQHKDNLEDPDWNTLSGAENVSATGGDTSFTYTPGNGISQHFFRLMQTD